MSDYSSLSRPLWDHRAKVHANNKSDYYDLDAFKAGENTLTNVELEALGDVSGKSMLHLQCHIGLDTLSWARLGADVTGVDFSGESIKVAQQLADELRLTAEFIESDIYRLPDVLSSQYDIVFTSYGVLSWLNDLERWGEIVARFLKPGGTFFIVEFHPVSFTFPFDETLTPSLDEPYFAKEPFVFSTDQSYASGETGETHTMFNWSYPLGKVVTALAKAGLRIIALEEMPYATYPFYGYTEQGDDGLWWPKMGKDTVPLMFSITATC